MEDQEKQANTVSQVVILVGCAFAALFVAMVVVMAVRGAPRAASTYTMTTESAPTGSAVFYRSGSEAPLLYSRETPVAPLERASGLLPVSYTGSSDVVFYSRTYMGPNELPVIYQWASTRPPNSLYVPAARVVLDDADPKEKKK